MSSEDSQFVELAQADLESFQQAQEIDRVLLFPPVNNYLRLLIHKTVESYPPLHSFSVGEGTGRQTVVCWKQALTSPDQENQNMSATRPPSSRGRGRGILRDYHSQSPAARSDEEMPQRSSSTDNARDQEAVTASAEKRERRERKTRRPDVQVYVPRGRRLHVQSSRSPQNNDRTFHSKPDDIAVDSQKSVGRGHRYSSSPQHRVRSSPQGPGGVAASTIGSILKEQTNSSKLDNRSQIAPGIDTDLIQKEVVNNDNLDSKDIASSPLTKLKEIARNKNIVETDQVSPVRDDFSEMNQTNDEILENCHDALSDENVSEHERKINKQCNEMYDNSKTEPHSRLGKSDDKERCIKKMKISETSDQNVNYNLGNGNNLCDDAKISQVLHSETNSMEIKSELNTPSELNSDLSQENCTNDHRKIALEAKALDSVVFEKDLEDFGGSIESQNVGLYQGAIETDTIFENIPKVQNEHIITEKESEKQVPTELSSDSKPVSNDDNSLVINDTCSLKEGDIQSTCAAEETTDETLSVDLRQTVKNNLSDDQHEQLQMQETVQDSNRDSCDIDRHFCDLKPSDVDEVNISQMEDISLASGLQNDNLSIEKAINEQSCDKRDSQTSHKTSTDVFPESNIEVSDVTASILETEHAARDEVVEHSEQQGMMEIDTTQARECQKSCDDVNDIDIDDNAQEDGLPAQDEDCRQNTLDSDRNDEIECHPMLTDEAEKSEVDMTAKRVMVHITPDQSMIQTEKHPDTTVDQSDEQPYSGADQSDEETWDTMFDDNGDCLDPSAMEELTRTVGKVKIQKSKKINYLDYKPKNKSAELDYTEYGHIIEIYDFPAEFVTRDLIMAFQAFMSRGFDLKWVDDTHALGVFSSSIAAQDALNIMHPLLKVCPLSQATPQSKAKARRCTEFLQPYKPRPETSAVAARRLVAGALGLQSKVPKEKRDKERQQLKEAKAKRRQDRQNKDDIWEGRLGKCAMDDEG